MTIEQKYSSKVDAINIVRNAINQSSAKDVETFRLLLRIQNHIIADYKLVRGQA